MIVESLNIGLPKKEKFCGKEIRTSIGKRPVPGSVHLKKPGFVGDGVSDTKHHGGPDKAACVYSLDHYPYWEKVLGIKLLPAAFGENLTVSNLKEEEVCIGDIFQLGTAMVQISQPRQPCKTLAARYGRKDLVKLVVESGYTGFYLRVLQEGKVEAGSPLSLKEKDPGGVSVALANNIMHHDRKNYEGIDRILSIPALSSAWQRDLGQMREKAKA